MLFKQTQRLGDILGEQDGIIVAETPLELLANFGVVIDYEQLFHEMSCVQ
jgi:hypothetical protein